MSSCSLFCSFSVTSGQLFLLIRSKMRLHHLFASVEGCVWVAFRVTLWLILEILGWRWGRRIILSSQCLKLTVEFLLSLCPLPTCLWSLACVHVLAVPNRGSLHFFHSQDFPSVCALRHVSVDFCVVVSWAVWCFHSGFARTLMLVSPLPFLRWSV